MRLSRSPPLKNLRAFCVAARQLSFKFAADELCLTPSAVSHQMKELETILGMRLFERRTRALELTAAGQRLLEEVEPLLEGLDRALAQLARHDGRETLRVRAPALFANELLIPRLEEFCGAHTAVSGLENSRALLTPAGGVSASTIDTSAVGGCATGRGSRVSS